MALARSLVGRDDPWAGYQNNLLQAQKEGTRFGVSESCVFALERHVVL